MLCMIENPKLRERLIGNANEFVKRYTWDANQVVYLNLVDSLVASNSHNVPK